GATALGSALIALPLAPQGQSIDGVVVVSDGVVNAGEDPAAAARALGVPVHAVTIGHPGARDRAVLEVESSTRVRVGEATPVRVRLATTEPAGSLVPVRILDGGRERAHGPITGPAGGAAATAALRGTPTPRGLPRGPGQGGT